VVIAASILLFPSALPRMDVRPRVVSTDHVADAQVQHRVVVVLEAPARIAASSSLVGSEKFCVLA
jgi:hypothetical protein